MKGSIICKHTTANGLSVTTQHDSNGDGTFETTRTGVASLNADGSRTETVTDNAAGVNVDQTIITTSGNGLTTTAQYDLSGSGAFTETRSDVTAINADGSKTETVSYTGANGGLISRFVATTSATYDTQMKGAGAFVVNCNHGGGHCQAPAALYTAAWQFMKDHPFGVDPEPYSPMLPTTFPDYCAAF